MSICTDTVAGIEAGGWRGLKADILFSSARVPTLLGWASRKSQEGSTRLEMDAQVWYNGR